LLERVSRLSRFSRTEPRRHGPQPVFITAASAIGGQLGPQLGRRTPLCSRPGARWHTSTASSPAPCWPSGSQNDPSEVYVQDVLVHPNHRRQEVTTAPLHSTRSSRRYARGAASACGSPRSHATDANDAGPRTHR
jgi:hypothetical protein